MNTTPLSLQTPPASGSRAIAPSVDHEIQAIVAGASPGSTCTTDLAAGPWDFDGRPGYGPGASMGDVIPTGSPRQGELPAEYRDASDDELDGRIRAAKQTLGERVVVLGHFYQRDEVVRHADYVGDSFQLAGAARAHPEAEAIVFCGVHFMAETADLLSRPEQAVILPNLAAGCSMADMADIDQVEECWEQLEDLFGDMAAPDADGLVPVVPVTYMNSSAAIKGFVGRHGGIVCTSSNARTVLEWAFARGRRVLFFPDQHLGRNTAKAMGVPLERMPMWNPTKPWGGTDAETLRDSRVILWHGFCSVHRRFTVDQIDRARAEHPGVRVIVHPECPMPVVDAADESGSTDYIRKAIQAATEPTTFAVGTEINLVRRLAAEHPQHHIFCLDPVVCPCSTMYRIHPGYLAWVLESLVAGTVINRISVPQDVADPARVALERMLAAKPPAGARP
ncbi:quinolinate synthase NadA [Microbacterium sp. zg.Y1090]|uniref:quinolinate synthase NadA n=1 Tax=Microbacterium TaxID=33882 RepID=UPI00214CB855|nr:MULTISPECIES: quinolinate synthase NadA [unclassified Microbacterium]MCR2812106.1 quinolinate synthase NadA [Microbacterium sp. zg.Y1084]MCR2818456.1 quinolinate synthase NadA [Microbacterium sp. zg.Y1090]MDL5486269.1 quinolinate synthase NadA [Microbacterium sp. zg-Y1211]WIM29466.1 quinolinate synthase NadA [Microbacterium sp. zg-Y1090]